MIAIISMLAMAKYLLQDLSVKETANEVIFETTEESLAVSEHHIPIVGFSQEAIPTGCESVSTVALLNYWGIEISPEQFIEEYLPQKTFYRFNGKLYGPDPNEYFAGDPFQKSSLGCFPNVIVKALNNMKNDQYPGTEHMRVLNITGITLDVLAEAYLSNDIPVLVWVTIDMLESQEGTKYLLEDGTTYIWRKNEHCVVFCGYDENNYYLMDPLKNGSIVSYPKDLVEQRYSEMNMGAVVLLF